MIETNKLSVADVDKLKHVYGTNNNIVSVSIAEIEQTKKRPHRKKRQNQKITNWRYEHD